MGYEIDICLNLFFALFVHFKGSILSVKLIMPAIKPFSYKSLSKMVQFFNFLVCNCSRNLSLST